VVGDKNTIGVWCSFGNSSIFLNRKDEKTRIYESLGFEQGGSGSGFLLM